MRGACCGCWQLAAAARVVMSYLLFVVAAVGDGERAWRTLSTITWDGKAGADGRWPLKMMVALDRQERAAPAVGSDGRRESQENRGVHRTGR